MKDVVFSPDGTLVASVSFNGSGVVWDVTSGEELAFLFLTIAIGLGFGADQKLAVIIGFLFIVFYLVGKNLFYKRSSQESQNLVITVSALNPVKDQLKGIIEVLKKFSEKISLKRFDENQNTLETSFIVEVQDFQKINDAKTE